MYIICVLHEPIMAGRAWKSWLQGKDDSNESLYTYIFALTLIKQPNQTMLELHDCDEKNEYSHYKG